MNWNFELRIKFLSGIDIVELLLEVDEPIGVLLVLLLLQLLLLYKLSPQHVRGGRREPGLSRADWRGRALALALVTGLGEEGTLEIGSQGEAGGEGRARMHGLYGEVYLLSTPPGYSKGWGLGAGGQG